MSFMNLIYYCNQINYQFNDKIMAKRNRLYKKEWLSLNRAASTKTNVSTKKNVFH